MSNENNCDIENFFFNNDLFKYMSNNTCTRSMTSLNKITGLTTSCYLAVKIIVMYILICPIIDDQDKKNFVSNVFKNFINKNNFISKVFTGKVSRNYDYIDNIKHYDIDSKFIDDLNNNTSEIYNIPQICIIKNYLTEQIYNKMLNRTFTDSDIEYNDSKSSVDHWFIIYKGFIYSTYGDQISEDEKDINFSPLKKIKLDDNFKLLVEYFNLNQDQDYDKDKIKNIFNYYFASIFYQHIKGKTQQIETPDKYFNYNEKYKKFIKIQYIAYNFTDYPYTKIKNDFDEFIKENYLPSLSYTSSYAPSLMLRSRSRSRTRSRSRSRSTNRKRDIRSLSPRKKRGGRKTKKKNKKEKQKRKTKKKKIY